MTRDELQAAAARAAADDPDVRALFLSGSLARGEGDAWSDLDLVLAAADASHPGFVARARDWVSGLAELVLWRQPYPQVPLFTSVTAEWLRLDLTVTVAARLPGTRATLAPLYDPEDLYAALPERSPGRRPDGARIVALAEEFMRILGLLPLGLGRGELAVAAEGVFLLRRQFVDLLVEAQAPPVPIGALGLSRTLPPADIALIEALPPVAATRDSVIAGSLACAKAFLPRARALAGEAGAAWPRPLEDALRRRLKETLGLDLP